MSEEEILTIARLVEDNTALTAERDRLAAELARQPTEVLRGFLLGVQNSMQALMEPVRAFNDALNQSTANLINPQGRWDRKIKAQAKEIHGTHQDLEAGSHR